MRYRVVFLATALASLAACGARRAQQLDGVYLEPMPTKSGEAVTDQVHLWQRARYAATLIPLDLVTTSTPIEEYRRSVEHDALKRTLQSLVDNKTAWPEYIYVTRLNAARTAYRYVLSSSDVIENHPLVEYSLGHGMQEALRFKRPYVTDVTAQYPAVYIPLYEDGTAVGFVVFAKLSWSPSQRNVLPAPATIEETTLLHVLDLERRLSGASPVEQAAEQTPITPPERSLAETSSAEVETKTSDGHLVLSYGTGRKDGIRSLGGSGHAIRFTRPAEFPVLHAVQLYGSRYGYPTPPKEDFEIYVLDADKKVVKTVRLPYSDFERGPQRWVTLPVGDVPVPETFWVALDFHPEQTKGVYVGFEKTGGPSHSMIGTPEQGFRDWENDADWMIRVDLTRADGVSKSE